jgi:hypothetical protein
MEGERGGKPKLEEEEGYLYLLPIVTIAVMGGVDNLALGQNIRPKNPAPI